MKVAFSFDASHFWPPVAWHYEPRDLTVSFGPFTVWIDWRARG